MVPPLSFIRVPDDNALSQAKNCRLLSSRPCKTLAGAAGYKQYQGLRERSRSPTPVAANGDDRVERIPAFVGGMNGIQGSIINGPHPDEPIATPLERPRQQTEASSGRKGVDRQDFSPAGISLGAEDGTETGTTNRLAGGRIGLVIACPVSCGCQGPIGVSLGQGIRR